MGQRHRPPQPIRRKTPSDASGKTAQSLWIACRAAFTPAASAAMADLHSPEPRDYVLLHRETGSALYTTRATEAEIHRANANLSRSGNRNRYVAARHLPHGRGEPQG
jgi:hypothetical protein